MVFPGHSGNERNVNMTEREMVLEETRRILARSPRPKKKRHRVAAPSAATSRALAEAGVSARDLEILQEGHRREVEFCSGVTAPASLRATLRPEVDHALGLLMEEAGAVGDGTSGSLTMPTGWSESAPGCHTCAKARGHRIMVDGQNWRHHTPDGRIAKGGTGAASLAEYARTIPGDWGGSQNASEALDLALSRIRHGERGPAEVLAFAESRLAERPVERGSVEAHRIAAERLRGDRAPVAAHRLIEAIRARAGQTAPTGDLHAKLRRGVTR
jgi:hypothetical protein